VSRHRLGTLLFVLFLALFVLWQSAGLEVFEADYDEGVYLSEARLLRDGYVLYREIKTPSPPLFIWGLAASFAVAGGPTVEAARLAVILTGALGLAAVALSAGRIAPRHGLLAGWVAALLLAFFPRWYLYGRYAMADVPSLSVSLLAVALALRAWPKGSRRWLALAGAGAALALLVKILAAYTAPLLALVVLLRDRPTNSLTSWLRHFFVDGLVTLAGFAVPLVVTLPLIDLSAAYDLLFRFPWEAGRQWTDPVNALRLMAIFLGEHVGWTLLGLVGIAWLIRGRAWRAAILIAGWLLLVVLMLSQHAPLWGHLMLPLVPPLAIGGGIAVAEAIAAWRARQREAGQGAAFPLVTAAALVAAILVWPVALQRDLATFTPVSRPTLLRTVLVPWLRATVPPDLPLISDDQMIAFRADRRVPPNLTDTSFTKIGSGFITAEELIATAERERPGAIIFWSDRFSAFPEWRAWVERHYTVACRYGENRVIFLRPDLAEGAESCQTS
jgi:4-amino-4-deoxy-L-arabinose transferase-like glycosyltransferase